MRLVLACLIVMLAAQSVRADELARANRLRYGGIALTATGVVATVVSQVLLAEGISWELGNGLGEHYDPTPSWVPRIETAGWALLGTGQAAIVGGIITLSLGDTRRDRARLHVTVAPAPSATGGIGFAARF